MLIANTSYQLEDIQVMPEILLDNRTVEGGLQLIRIMMLGLLETARRHMGQVGIRLAVLHVL